MRGVYLRMLPALIAVALTWSVPGQVPNVSGHWEGEIQAPAGPAAIQIDLVRDASGAIAGTFALPAQGMSESPVTTTLNGRDIRIKVAGGLPRSRTFTGTISEDGSTIAGTFNQTGYGALVSFTLRRSGEARVAPAATSGAVPAALEGVWFAEATRFTLVIRNEPGGASSVTVMSPGTEVRAHAIRVDGAKVVVDARAVGGRFEGSLDSESLTGTWKQASGSTQVSLRKLPAALTAIQGFWLATEIDGAATGDTEAVFGVFGDTYVVVVNGRIEERGTLKVDASASPAAIDFTIQSGASRALVQPGIMDIKDGVLRMSFAIPGADTRPTSFTAPEARVRFVAKKL
jgi:uncharacterized protein (TIGR03067 family)